MYTHDEQHTASNNSSTMAAHLSCKLSSKGKTIWVVYRLSCLSCTGKAGVDRVQGDARVLANAYTDADMKLLIIQGFCHAQKMINSVISK